MHWTEALCGLVTGALPTTEGADGGEAVVGEQAGGASGGAEAFEEDGFTAQGSRLRRYARAAEHVVD